MVNRSRRQLLERLEDRMCLSSAPNWAFGLGGVYDDMPMALTVDGQDNTFVAVGTADVSGGQQVSVIRQDAAGNPVGTPWVLSTSTAGQVLRIADLFVDGVGSLFVVGDFSGTINLGGQSLSSAGGGDVFLARYDAAGNFEWAERFGGPADDTATAMDIASGADKMADDVYVIGTFGQTATFLASTVSLTSTVGDYRAAFLFHVTDSRDGHWAAQLQTSGSATPIDIVVTDDGQQAFIAGAFGYHDGGDRKNTTTFSTPSGIQTLQTGRYHAALLLKYQLAPVTRGVQWACQIARSFGNQMSQATSLARAGDNSIYVAGNFVGFGVPTDFGATQFTANGDAFDGFLLRVEELNGAARTTSALQLDGDYPVYGLTVDTRTLQGMLPQTIVVSGTFAGSLAARGSWGGPVLTASGRNDTFLIELPLSGGTYLDAWQSGGDGQDNTGVYFWPLPQTVNYDVVTGASGSIYQLLRSSSALVPTVGGTVVTKGGADAVVVHVNPDAPQISVSPQNSPSNAPAIEQRNAVVFLGQAIDRQEGDVSSQLSWMLDGVRVAANTALLETSPLALGRHTLELHVTESEVPVPITASYSYVFHVAPNSPTGLAADVAIQRKTSNITLTWTDNSANESGFYVEQAELYGDLPPSWVRIGSIPQNVVKFTTSRAKLSSPVLYRVHSFAESTEPLTVVSPALETVTVNPSISGVYYSTPVAAVAASLFSSPAMTVIRGRDSTLEPAPTPPSSPGDANWDGLFDSNDLIAIMAAGEYEDDIPGNSTWEEGDWDGNGDFDSADFVIAFQTGLYEIESQPLGNTLAALDRLFSEQT